MKKLITILALTVVTASAFAGHVVESFLNPQIAALWGTTNSWPTNLNDATYGTNYVGVQWTNTSSFWDTTQSKLITGTWVQVTNNPAAIGWNTNSVSDGPGLPGTFYVTNSTLNPFQDVPLWSDVNMSGMQTGPAGVATNSLASLVIKLVGVSSDSQCAINFVFASVPDGKDEVSTSEFATSVTANGTTPVVSKIPLPSSLMIGCKSLRLRSVYGTATANKFNDAWIQSIELVGWKP